MDGKWTKVIWAILNDDPKADITKGLRLACEHGLIATVKFILMDCKPSSECVKIAAIHGHYDIVKVLFDNCPMTDDNNLARWAVLNNKIKVLELIGHPSRFLVGLIPLAFHHKNRDVFKYLTNDLTSDQIQQVFVDACKWDDYHLVEELITDPRVVPTDDNLAYAISNRKIDVVEVLLTDPRVIPNSQMLKWLTVGNITIAKMLLKHPNVDPSFEDYEAVRDACKAHHPYLVKVYLDHLDKTGQDDFGICTKDGCEILQFKFGNQFAICFKIGDRDLHCLNMPITAEIKERYLRWQYRIGGEKWKAACKDLELKK